VTDIFRNTSKPGQGGRDGAQVYIGAVLAVNGTTPGPASGITYDVRVDAGGGSVLPAMKPMTPRYPDSVDVVAIPVGSAVLVVRTEGAYYLMTSELPDLGPCTEPEE
jgi:hypothetical protein